MTNEEKLPFEITLLDKIKEIKVYEDYFDECVSILINTQDAHKCYLKACMDVGLSDIIDYGVNISNDDRINTEKILLLFVNAAREKRDKYLKEFRGYVDKIKMENPYIHGQTDFDFIDICVDSDNGFYVKYKPKNVSVSFYTAKAKDVLVNYKIQED